MNRHIIIIDCGRSFSIKCVLKMHLYKLAFIHIFIFIISNVLLLYFFDIFLFQETFFEGVGGPEGGK